VTIPPFQAFLDEHRDDVYRFLVAAAGPEAADDCFQETFLSALSAYPRLTGASNLRSWILTIAYRKAVDAHRARKRRAIPVGSVPEQPAPAPVDGHPELLEAVRALPAKQSGALLARYINDLDYGQVAEILGCSREAARRNVHEGLRKLREAYR
jgi:DNA-directed RNA polymerase specialized sigma24 family protein